MGVVFQAEDLQLKRTVALKVMKPEFGSDQELNERFLREARAVAAIEHENIVTIYFYCIFHSLRRFFNGGSSLSAWKR